MAAFTADTAAALPGPAWLRARRLDAFERFAAGVVPSDAEEVWRYSRIAELDLEEFSPAVDDGAVPPEAAALLEVLARDIGAHAGLVVVRNGRVVSASLDDAFAERGVVLAGVTTVAGGEHLLGSVAAPVDVFVDLATAFALDAVVARVPRGVVVDRPLVVVHLVDAGGAAVFPRLVVEAGETCEVNVVEVVVSTPGATALVVPVVELDVGPAANVSYVCVQELAPTTWQIAYQASRVDRDATLSSMSVALGGDYARVRTDSRLTGQGANALLRAVYFGDGGQMHDFRTLQQHDAPRTTSDLLFKGAVAGTAHSVYSGLIRVNKGARGTNAFQTNRNLVLSEGAHADSVPNLEIEENDVRCSHASAVGPVDAEQRYYLEARGVPPEVADRLIVSGFFEDVVDTVPIEGLRRRVGRALAAKVKAA